MIFLTKLIKDKEGKYKIVQKHKKVEDLNKNKKIFPIKVRKILKQKCRQQQVH